MRRVRLLGADLRLRWRPRRRAALALTIGTLAGSTNCSKSVAFGAVPRANHDGGHAIGERESPWGSGIVGRQGSTRVTSTANVTEEGSWSSASTPSSASTASCRGRAGPSNGFERGGWLVPY